MFGYKPTIWMPKVRFQPTSPMPTESYSTAISPARVERHIQGTLPAPIPPSAPGFHNTPQRLHKQCDNINIPTIPPSADAQPLIDALARTDVILDAIFGFSFQPPVRAPFDAALPLLTASRLPIVSVDIPSGWAVEKGNAAGVGLNPDVLLSLTAPKEGAREFRGRHFLGGRFVPKCVVSFSERGVCLNLVW